jgi:two-component system, OmpR family, sensor histidine kinase RstB
MRRLHVQFYLAILAALAVLTIASGLFWRFSGERHGAALGISTAGELAQLLLPPASASAAEQQRSIDELHRRLQMDLALYDGDGHLLATTAGAPRIARRRLEPGGWALVRGAGHVWILPLDDGRRLVVRPRHPEEGLHSHVLIAAVALVLAFVLGAYPIARRLTRRLARLQSGVEQLGQGDLATRVPVEGRDEVAALARSFNRSAERIQELVGSYKLLLANCSHELRTPLARIRLGLERLAADPDDPIRGELRRSVAELDALIDEMLLASRLDALNSLERAEDVDLLALAAEEAAHFDRSVEGQPIIVHGDPGLLRRMIRNLLANAERHGGGASRIHVDAEASGAARLVVEDRGPGVGDGDRERIFEPFYRGRSAGATLEGAGLGLAIVRQIARAHGGEVSYAPVEGGGSRFSVTLPVRR